MRSRTRLYALPLLFGLAVFAGCGDDDGDGGMGPGTGGDELTAQESQEMVEALAAVGSFSLDLSTVFGGSAAVVDGPQMALAAAAAAEPIDEDFDATVDCPAGGSIHQDGNVNGDIDSQTGQGTLNFNFVQTHMDCVGTSDSGTTFTFNGAPNITTDMDFTISESSFAFDGTQGGTLGWETGGKSGSCGIDLTFDFSGNQSSFQGSVTGTVCGQSIDENVNESF